MRLDFKNQKPLASEDLSQQDVQFAVEDAKQQLNSDILATKRAIFEKEKAIAEIKTTYPLDVKAYVEISAELDGLEDGLKRIKALQKELNLL